MSKNSVLAASARTFIQHGQCYLNKSGSDLILTPLNGNRLVIAGVPQIIPSAGVTLPPAGLSAATLYYIYAYMAGTVLTLEASATGHSYDTATGIEVKTGDVSRTLVGAWRTAGAATWSTIATEGASYFNRRTKTSKASFSANRSTSSNSYVELNSEIRVSFFTWGDELPETTINGSMVNSLSTGRSFAAVSWNGGTVQAGSTWCNGEGVNAQFPFSVYSAQPDAGRLAEGVHYSTLFGAVGIGGTATYSGSLSLTTNTVTIKG